MSLIHVNYIYQNIPPQIHFMNPENMIYLEQHSKNTKGMEYMAHFNVNWKDYTDMLARKAKEENWSNKTYPNNGILTNYLVHTYKKA